MIGKFFHTPAPKKFFIPPRFWDPEKEERENRERRIREELGIAEEKKDDGKPFRPNIRGQFRNPSNWKGSTTQDAINSQRRRLTYLIILLIALFLLVYYADRIF